MRWPVGREPPAFSQRDMHEHLARAGGGHRAGVVAACLSNSNERTNQGNRFTGPPQTVRPGHRALLHYSFYLPA